MEEKIKLKVYSKTGEILGERELPKEIFDIEPNDTAIYEAIRMYQANKRKGTASTKTRAEVRGGGRKPWPQKHTGRARAGSIRSPIWRGGGIAFGPKPRNYHYRIPKKILKLALLSCISYKMRDGEILLIDNIDMEAPKTKLMSNVIKALGLDGKKTLFIPKEINKNTYLAGRNIPTFSIKRAKDVNALDIAENKIIIFTIDGVEAFIERMS